MGLGLNCIVDNVILCVGSQKNSSILEIIKSNRVKETWLYIYIYMLVHAMQLGIEF